MLRKGCGPSWKSGNLAGKALLLQLPQIGLRVAAQLPLLEKPFLAADLARTVAAALADKDIGVAGPGPLIRIKVRSRP